MKLYFERSDYFKILCFGLLTAWLAAIPSSAQAARDILPEITGVDPVAAIYVGCLLFFLTGFAAGVFTLYFWMQADAPDNGGDDAKPDDDRPSNQSEARSRPYNSQSGNIFFALFGDLYTCVTQLSH